MVDGSACRTAGVYVTLLVVMLWVTPSAASAQVTFDPAAAVDKYSAALNAQDLPGALALFAQYGSATDVHGRNFSGADGLTGFLLGNGFATPDARITTERLSVVANRAIWTYTCTCAAGATTVHLVLTTDGKISVFGMVRPAAPPAPTRTAKGIAGWLIAGTVLLTGGLGWVLGPWRKRRAVQRTRPTQGYLLLALRQTHAARSEPRSNRRDEELFGTQID